MSGVCVCVGGRRGGRGGWTGFVSMRGARRGDGVWYVECVCVVGGGGWSVNGCDFVCIYYLVILLP